jgi:hypothetical protein
MIGLMIIWNSEPLTRLRFEPLLGLVSWLEIPAAKTAQEFCENFHKKRCTCGYLGSMHAETDKQGLTTNKGCIINAEVVR